MYTIMSYHKKQQQQQAISLMAHYIRILNLFVTYGDTFLPNPTTYDE